MSNLNMITPLTVQGIINKFCYTIGMLPTSYKQSLTYEEQLLAIGNYLESTVYPAINSNAQALAELQSLFAALQDYVDNYFDNLDVTQEINAKLDDMAANGELTQLIGAYVDPELQAFRTQVNGQIQQQNSNINTFKNDVNNQITEFETSTSNTINTQNNVIGQIETKVNTVTNGSPLVASSTSEMTDTTKTYVNTTDGKWYYYDGDSWEIGGTYQSAGIGSGGVGYENLNNSINESLSILQDKIFDHSKTWVTSNTENGLVKKDGSITAAGTNHWGYVTAAVDSPKKVTIFGSMGVGNATYPLVAFFSGNTVSSANLISCIDSSADNNEKWVDVDVPNGTVLIAVNSWSINSQKYPAIGIYSYDSNVYDKIYTYDFEEAENPTSGTNGWNVYKQPGDVHHSLTAPVGDAKKVRITGSGGGTIPLCVFIDYYSRPIEVKMPTTSWISSTEIFDVPNGTYYVVAQDWNNLGINIELSSPTDITLQNLDARVAQLEDGSTTTDVEFNTMNWKHKLINEQLKNDFAWKSYNKAYVSFTFDDLNNDMSAIADLFITKGVKLCLAVPPNRLSATLTGGETGQDLCERVVAAGGEVLSHDFNVITENSTEADYKRQFYTDKLKLVSAGFDVNGIILAGGADYLTANFDKCVQYMRPYFDYSDLYGYGTGVTQYYHPRTWINATESINENAIQSAINNKEWISFASHGTSEVSLQLLEDLLDYVLSLSTDNIEIVTFKELFTKEGSSKLEERIKLLES